MERKKKVLLIGEDGFDIENDDVRVVSYSWENIVSVDNVSDYDTVIVSLLSHKSDFNKTESEGIRKKLNLHSIIGVIKHNGMVIIVGDPRKKIFSGHYPNELETNSFLDWTGISFVWDNAPGDTIKFPDPDKYKIYNGYVSEFHRWNYSLSEHHVNKHTLLPYFEDLGIGGTELYLDSEIREVCVNRSNRPVVFSIWVGIFSRNDRNKNVLFGGYVFLPEIDRSIDDVLTIILRDFCRVTFRASIPKWIEEMAAPNQSTIDMEISNLESSINELIQEKESAIQKRQESRACLKLLYTGDIELEIVTRDILRALGAKVEEPTEKGKSDGWISVVVEGKIYEGILEIKSTKNDQFNEDGIRQLVIWQQWGIEEHNKKYKKIFIGNSAINKPFEDRPSAFSDNWKRNAQMSEVSAIKTEVLYKVYSANLEGRLNKDAFWKLLFDTNGIVEINSTIVS